MGLFPIVLIAMGAVYLIATIAKCRKKYTKESMKIQWITLLCFMAFTLHTGISTRIFRLFKCRKIQDTWYLTADYTVDSQMDCYQKAILIVDN